MANTIREAIRDKIADLKNEADDLEAVLWNTRLVEVLAIEVDDVALWSKRWYRISDETHPSLCVDLMELGLSPQDHGRKTTTKQGMKARFYLSGDDYIFVDVVRPDKRCKKARVLVTEERTIMLCGDLPENYELIEVLGNGDSQEL